MRPHFRKVTAYLFLPLVLLLGARAPAQVIAFNFDTNEWRGDRFRSFGIDSTGSVWIVGEYFNVYGLYYEESLVEYTVQAGFRAIPLGFSPNGDPTYHGNETVRISRDGKYVVGTASDEDGQHPALWSRTNPGTPRFLGPFPPDDDPEPWDVASTPEGAVVVGRYGFGTFIWTESGGYRAWMTNSDFWPLRHTYRISADATKWVGQQYSWDGTNLSSTGFLGTESSLEYLDWNRRTNTFVFGLSPNGEHAVGVIDPSNTLGRQIAIWRKNHARTLSFGTNVFLIDAVTDSGIAGGASVLGGVIFDSHGHKVELFDDWWTRRYPTVPLPAHVRRVHDLQEYGGNLYCLISLEDLPTDFRTTALAIAPLKNDNSNRNRK